jgi:site-specific DNA recombinase
MHNLFQEYLSPFKLGDKYLKPLKLKLLNIYDSLIKSESENVGAFKGRITDLNSKIETLEERSALGEISQELFLKYSSKYKAERSELKDKLPKTTLETSNLEEYFQIAIEFAKSLRESWEEGTYRIREMLQYLVFPDGIVFDREKEALRTEKVNFIFDRIADFHRGNGNGQKKEGGKLATLIQPADWTGFEPATSSVTGKHSNQLNYQSLKGCKNILFFIPAFKL